MFGAPEAPDNQRVEPGKGSHRIDLEFEQMSKKLIAALASLSLAGLSGTALAADGTLTFEGVINSKTCILDPGSASQTVNLPPVRASEFQNAGQAVGEQTFSLKASGCDADAMVAAVFASGGNVDPATGNLNNTIPTSAGGTDAQVALYQGDGSTKLDLSDPASSGGYQTQTDGSGNATLEFVAKYMSKNATTAAGVLKTNLQYTMSYQ
ncbi:major type 1 subunit fimbrin (pilin) [Pseudomonas delhiensis]|uniref:Major type 1 subunit fimbrin (Pilin) n=2 Tax=Pseudomonas delhiensis TaxID=366289 RepID=A0A239HYY7_9PSED|nr:major type 1 subunit fimbrin (pilin) [Pseudomonas delhiensis]SNS86696.1 major type 1 subunit fimbrin (pilin) [Pseudomonas delhiensis]